VSGAIDFLAGIAGEAIVLALVVGAALGAVLGLLLLFDSARALRWNERLSRWVSTREAMRPLDAPRDIKRFVYRGHRLVGLLVVAGALYSLDALTFGFSTEALARALRDLGNQGLLGVAFDSMRAFFLLGNAAALAAGIVLCLRPQALQRVEAWADRTYTPATPASRLDEMRFQPDQWVARHPRLTGAVALLGSAFILFQLAIRPLL
jgi:hypothetical protein